MALTKRFYANHKTVITAENMNDIQDAILALEKAAGIVPGAGEATRNIAVVNPKGNYTLIETVALPDGLYWFANPVTFKDETQTETFQLYGLVAKTGDAWLTYDNGRTCVTDENGVMIAWTYTSLPDATEENEGKVLAVVEGKWEVAEPQQVFPLEEAHVYPMNEPQELLPNNGYCGFSKIIVDAVEDSGSSGGGDDSGGGSGGWDDIVIPPSAGDVSFGFEMVEDENEEVPTGYLIHIDAVGGVTRFKSYPVEYQYQYIISSSNDTAMYMYQTQLPMVSFDGTSWDGQRTSASYVRYDYDFETETWTPTAWGSSDKVFIRTHAHWVWYSHDVYYIEAGTLASPASEPFIVETEPALVEKPVEVEEEYTVSGESVNNLVALAQKVTGTTEPMTIDEATQVLDEYYANPAEGSKW